MIFFERLIQWFDTLVDHTLQEEPKWKILNINIIKSEYMKSVLTIQIISSKTLFRGNEEQWKNTM